MNKDDINYFEGLLVKAIQSGKQETSGLVDMIIHKQEPAIEKSIEKYVNGHLKEIKIHLENQDKQQNKQDEQIEKVLEEQKLVKENLIKTDKEYSVDKAKIWVAITLLLFFGGTIITLAIMAINSKIKDGISQALLDYDKTIEYVE